MAAQQLNASDAHPVLFSMYCEEHWPFCRAEGQSLQQQTRHLAFDNMSSARLPEDMKQQHETLVDEINTARKLEPNA